MHEINDAIVQGGRIVLSHLPFADGQRVRVWLSQADEVNRRIPIKQVRQALKGGVERFEDPFEPMIPGESWEMHK
ncbi:MAG: hypothetical protein ABSH22_20635 [Tepidisphaeraceae bacterium]|jgi:hypothetical protein